MRRSVELRGAGGDEAERACRQILDSLPQWFGIPEANDDYVAMAGRHPTLLASAGTGAVGITTVLHHSPYAAEIYLMAVRPTHHRQGIGRAMLERVETDLAANGVEFLQVKTLSPAHPDAGYALTRAFYLAAGFRPLEEFPTLWDPANPALQMIKSVPRPPSSSRTVRA